MYYSISLHFGFILFQDLRAQWEKDAEAMEANFQTSLLEIQNSLSATQTELTSTQASLAEAQEAVSQKQLEVQETQASIEELQTSSKEQTQKLEALKRALAERDAAVCESFHSSHIPQQYTLS